MCMCECVRACTAVCVQAIDRALSPAAGSEVMDDAAERYLNPLTSAGLTDRAGRGSESRWRGLATHHTSQRQQTSQSLETRANNLIQLFSKGSRMEQLDWGEVRAAG